MLCINHLSPLHHIRETQKISHFYTNIYYHDTYNALLCLTNKYKLYLKAL